MVFQYYIDENVINKTILEKYDILFYIYCESGYQKIQFKSHFL